MTTFYIDPVLGADANAGTAWGAGNAWKTIKLGATAARIAPGDIIKVAKSPDPTSIGNAAWTLNSKTVTLASACTLSIDLCETSWVGATADITVAASAANRKEGANNVSITIGAAFTTGKVAYKTLPAALDLSGYQQVSFWFRDSLGNAGSLYKLCLCSDNVGATIVDEFVISAISATQKAIFVPLTINKGSALGSAINSVALYALSDPGIPILMIDNIIAVKAISSADSLSLTSLISTNSAATGGDEPWYPIQSINGTTVFIDNGATTLANIGKGACIATTASVATYKRECFKPVTATDYVVQDSGTTGNLIQFQCGYDPSTDTQDGETFFDMLASVDYGLDLTSKSFLLINRINFVRTYTGVYVYSSTDCEINGQTVCGSGGSGIYFYGAIRCKTTFVGSINNIGAGVSLTTACIGCEITIKQVCNNITNGFSIGACPVYNKATIDKASNNTASNISFGGATYEFVLKCLESKDSGAFGIEFVTLSKRNRVIGMTTSGNTSGAISYPTLGENFLRGCTLGETIKTAGHVAFCNSRLASDYQDGSADNNYVYTDGGYIKSQAAVRHTASGIAWQIFPTHANRGVIQYPMYLPIARLAVNANATVTFTAWLIRNNAGIQANIRCKGLQISGVDTDILSSDLTTENAWTQRSITFTPTEAGVVEIEVIAFGGTTYYACVDDVDYYQA